MTLGTRQVGAVRLDATHGIVDRDLPIEVVLTTAQHDLLDGGS